MQDRDFGVDLLLLYSPHCRLRTLLWQNWMVMQKSDEIVPAEFLLLPYMREPGSHNLSCDAA